MDSFKQQRSASGKLKRAWTTFGKGKEIAMTPFHVDKKTYVHIKDRRRGESISLSNLEVEELQKLLLSTEQFHATFFKENQPRYEPVSPPCGSAMESRPGIFDVLNEQLQPHLLQSQQTSQQAQELQQQQSQLPQVSQKQPQQAQELQQQQQQSQLPQESQQQFQLPPQESQQLQSTSLTVMMDDVDPQLLDGDDYFIAVPITLPQ